MAVKPPKWPSKRSLSRECISESSDVKSKSQLGDSQKDLLPDSKTSKLPKTTKENQTEKSSHEGGFKKDSLSTREIKNQESEVEPKPPVSTQPADDSAKAVDKELEEYTRRKIQTKTLDLIGRTGGVYIPPYKLAELQKKVTDVESPEYQRQSWEMLRKAINGLVNKVNISNIATVVEDLFRENLNRGRGLVARSIIRAQMASPGFTHIYASLCAILNSKLPDLGNLILRRVLLQFRRAYRRNDKLVCKACMSFFAHMVNQRMVHELLALQLAMLLLEKLTDDSVELCIDFVQQVGQTLQEVVPQAFRAIMDRLRSIAQEGNVDQRVQYMIEGCQRVVATKFAEYPAIIPDLDLLEDDDKITHEIDLLDANVQGDEMLNVFKPIDPREFLKNEADWKFISSKILGDDDEDNEEDAKSDSTSEDSEDETVKEEGQKNGTVVIKDLTEKDIVMLRKTIYLTIMSSANFEECLHKILKMNIKEGQEIHVCTMFIDCNAMERTYQTFFALQAERLCRINPVYIEGFLDCFERQYSTIHHLETNKIRSTAKFFAHLLYTDAIPWSCLEKVQLTEETTTSASRIFLKILFQELAEQMGYAEFYKKLKEPSVAEHLKGIFPTDSFRHVRFAINFFTAISLGEATTELREFLANAQNQDFESSDSDSSSVSSSDEDSESDSLSASSSSSSSASSSSKQRKNSKPKSTTSNRRSVASATPSDSLSDSPFADEKSVDSETAKERDRRRRFLLRDSKSPLRKKPLLNTKRVLSPKSNSIRNRPFSLNLSPKPGKNPIKQKQTNVNGTPPPKSAKRSVKECSKARSLSRSIHAERH